MADWREASLLGIGGRVRHRNGTAGIAARVGAPEQRSGCIWWASGVCQGPKWAQVGPDGLMRALPLGDACSVLKVVLPCRCRQRAA
jgi:hypothetical protein